MIILKRGFHFQVSFIFKFHSCSFQHNNCFRSYKSHTNSLTSMKLLILLSLVIASVFASNLFERAVYERLLWDHILKYNVSIEDGRAFVFRLEVFVSMIIKFIRSKYPQLIIFMHFIKLHRRLTITMSLSITTQWTAL